MDYHLFYCFVVFPSSFFPLVSDTPNSCLERTVSVGDLILFSYTRPFCFFRLFSGFGCLVKRHFGSVDIAYVRCVLWDCGRTGSHISVAMECVCVCVCVCRQVCRVRTLQE